jgi:site-specific DNA-cytosine methylase
VRGGGEYSGKKGGEIKPNEHGGTGMLSYVEKTFTLAATQDQYVAQPVHTPASEVAPTITSSGPPYSRTGNQRVETEALVTVTNPTHIAFQPGNLVRRAGANPSTEAFPTLSKDSGDQNPHIATDMVVRRITPREAERLQGFPDDWTMIPWNGKPAEECPDGHRYKACGNSMATPVMRWIGLRLAFVDSVLQSQVCRTTSESSQTHSSNEQS